MFAGKPVAIAYRRVASRGSDFLTATLTPGEMIYDLRGA
jgi:hypothetical protein